jgi:S-adenosylmethionine:tRNA ribosyltransferase-isomerase
LSQPKHISISDYSYDLPEGRIALYPLPARDQSKLLIYKGRTIKETIFRNLAEHLPEKSLVIFNDTRVINARILFQKPTGGRIEIFCLEPIRQNSKKGENTWHCLVGGAAKWKEGLLSHTCTVRGTETQLSAECLERKGEVFTIRFTWNPELNFEEVIDAAGTVPLPPYLKRAAEPEDAERYQTIYAAEPGSVAAPTAGLHFTDTVMHDLQSKNIQTGFVTLHVSAGTFKPVDAATMEGHKMHAEWIDVKKEMIQKISQHEGPVVPVGTTSMRTLETLYWLGVKARLQPNASDLHLTQWELYEKPLSEIQIEKKEALQSLLDWMERSGMENLFTRTELLIAPGYRFRICRALITNFHQPRSTLLLLVAAVTGSDWKKIYEYALTHDFRFLSYGDSGLLFTDQG